MEYACGGKVTFVRLPSDGDFLGLNPNTTHALVSGTV